MGRVHSLKLVAPSESDAELIASVAQGDLSPLGILYDRYSESVRQFVARATAGSVDADDVVHETFLTLRTIADKYDGRASARPFLIGIAAQLLRRRRRSLARFAQAIQMFSGAFLDKRTRTPEEAASDHEEMDRFERALSSLTEEKRMTFLLVEREGLSGEEAARILGIPVNTVWTRLHHARAELRGAID